MESIARFTRSTFRQPSTRSRAGRPKRSGGSILLSIQVSGTWVSDELCPSDGGMVHSSDGQFVFHDGSVTSGNVRPRALAQHLGDCNSAPKSGDLVAAAHRRCDIDRPSRVDGQGAVHTSGMCFRSLVQIRTMRGLQRGCRCPRRGPASRGWLCRARRREEWTLRQVALVARMGITLRNDEWVEPASLAGMVRSESTTWTA